MPIVQNMEDMGNIKLKIEITQNAMILRSFLPTFGVFHFSIVCVWDPVVSNIVSFIH